MSKSLTQTAVVIAASLLTTHCSKSHELDPPDPRPMNAPASSEVSTLRRPSRKYYLGRTGDRCEVYSIEGGQVSPGEATPCPQDLLGGERIRLAGATCIREGSQEASREKPVVCPDPLTNREKWDRQPKDAN